MEIEKQQDSNLCKPLSQHSVAIENIQYKSQEKDQSTTHRTSNQTREVETDRARFQKKK